jgi:hypothetical protein
LAIQDCPSVPIAQPIGRHFERDWVVGWYYNPLYGGSYWSTDEAIYFYPLWKWYYCPHAGFGTTPTHPTANYLPYDVNYDGKVNMQDIGMGAYNFGGKYEPPVIANWHFRVDVNNDRKVDMQDIARIAQKFGCVQPTWVPP